MNVNHIYIKEGATLHIRRRGALSCGVMDDVRETCVPAVCAPALGVLPDAVCGVGMRPQGGGGVDHPTKVQQNKAQTEIHFFRTPGAIVTLQVSSANYNN
jgi:hypothetical protein